MKYQQKISEHLQNLFEKKSELTAELADLLSISSDSAYRRLRGDTGFTADELAKLSEKYNFSLDELLPNSQKNKVSMSFHSIFHQENVFTGYMKEVSSNVKKLKEENGKITYVARDLPISQSFRYPILRKFKLYYWQRVILNRSRMQDILFDHQIDLGKIDDAIDELMLDYGQTQRSEFWSEDTLSTTLRQIRYCHAFGLFGSDDDCKAVFDGLRIMLKGIEKELETQEAGKNSLEFYKCEVELSNNYIFLEHNQKRRVYLNFNTFNSLESSNADFCNEIEEMISRVKKKSTILSGQSDIHRKLYFKQMREKLAKAEEGLFLTGE